MKQYVDLVNHIMLTGTDKMDRTGTGTRSIFGHQMRFNLKDGFPLVSVKKTYWKGVVHELLWFLKGSTNTKYLIDNNVHIWDEWADKNGDLGPVYGKQWRSWTPGPANSKENTIDQIDTIIKTLRTNPDSRRIIVNAWNVSDLDSMALPPCHLLFQFYVANGELSCQLYQRSADVFLGVPFNIASYALLTHMIADQTGLNVGEFIHTIGDAHIYHNHFDQVKEMIARDPKPLPRLYLNPDIASIDDYTFFDISLLGYDPHPAIKGEVSV